MSRIDFKRISSRNFGRRPIASFFIAANEDASSLVVSSWSYLICKNFCKELSILGPWVAARSGTGAVVVSGGALGDGGTATTSGGGTAAGLRRQPLGRAPMIDGYIRGCWSRAAGFKFSKFQNLKASEIKK